MTSSCRTRGFTLLELLIAVAIFSLLATGCYRLFKSVSRTHEVASALWQQSSEVQRAVLILNKDFSQMIARPIRNEFGDQEPAFVALANGHMVMTRSGWRNFTLDRRSDLQRVGYRIDGGRLIRRYWNTLDRAPDTPFVEQVVLDDVQSFSLRLRDSQKRWHTSWPPRSDKQSERLLSLPTAVEYTLEHQQLGQIQQLIVGAGLVYSQSDSGSGASGKQPSGSLGAPGQRSLPAGDASIYPPGLDLRGR